MNNQVHPIEFALAITLSSVESLLWIINELLGFHSTPTATATATAPETAPQAPQTAPTTINREYILTLTVKQLQAHTGIKSSRYNKARLIEHALSNN